MIRATYKLHNKKAAVLIYVLVIMTVMASIALSMLALARIGKLRSDVAGRDSRLDYATDFVIEKIGIEISDDLFGGEFYDYPGAEDPWLASIEPYYTGKDLDGDPNNGVITYHNETADESGNNFFFWKQITKLSFADFGTSSNQDMCLDPPTNLKTIPEYQESVYSGAVADADGDGIADARWFEIPGLKTEAGESCYAAVRIIDNSAMVNVNTSYYNNTVGPDNEYEYNGDTQLCVSLESLLNRPDDDIDEFHQSRRTDFETDEWYEFNERAAARSLYPYPAGDIYNLYGISDELELRHRFCINSPVTSRLEYSLPNTIGANPGNLSDNDYWGDMYDTYARRSRLTGSSGLEDFCVGMLGGGKYPDPNSPSGEYEIQPERRHLLTAFSKSRQILPSMEIKAFPDVLSALADIQDYSLEELRSAVKDSLTDSGASLNEFLNEELATFVDMKDYISMQYALNIAEYCDSDSEADFTLDTDTNVLYYGFDGVDDLAGFTLNCVGYGIYDHQTQANFPAAPLGTYYAIELYIKDGIAISTTYDYVVRVIRDGSVAHEMYLSEAINSIPADGFLVLTNTDPSSYAATVFSHPDASVKTFTDLDSQRGELEIQSNDKIVVYRKFDDTFLVTDYADVKLVIPVAKSDTAYYKRKQGRLGDADGLILPESIGAVESNFGNMCSLPLATDAFMSIYDINLAPANVPPVSPAQVANVFAVCSFTDQDAFSATPANLLDFQTFAGAVETHKRREINFGLSGVTGCDGFGRFDMSDEKYAQLLDIFTALTSFKNPTSIYATAAAYDGLDNDGDRLTTDIPLADDIDNDGDGNTDNAGEEAAKYRESAFCGLININTAPKAVLMTLPWIDEALAEAIIAYRDKTGTGPGHTGLPDYSDATHEAGFRNIYELINVTNDETDLTDYDIQKYAEDGVDITADDFLDLTPDDGAIDDYEERNIIVERLSNLITTRSDVFTAWIVIREGAHGPQKRKLCLFDRSNVWQQGDMPTVYVNDVND
ncbi:MAG: ComEA family DNA-binding protein [Phycisphaerae bacterium]